MVAPSEARSRFDGASREPLGREVSWLVVILGMGISGSTTFFKQGKITKTQ